MTLVPSTSETDPPTDAVIAMLDVAMGVAGGTQLVGLVGLFFDGQPMIKKVKQTSRENIPTLKTLFDRHIKTSKG